MSDDFGRGQILTLFCISTTLSYLTDLWLIIKIMLAKIYRKSQTDPRLAKNDCSEFF